MEWLSAHRQKGAAWKGRPSSLFFISSKSLSQVLSRKCYNHIVSQTLSDTRPEIANLQRSLLRKAGSARKLALLGQMNQTVRTLALSGLRSRYPDDTPAMLRRRLADLLLGAELACRVYGPVIEKS
jgi:hypothetical protein